MKVKFKYCIDGFQFEKIITATSFENALEYMESLFEVGGLLFFEEHYISHKIIEQ